MTAYVGPQTDRETLIKFDKKEKPFGPGWERIRLDAGLTKEEATDTGENIPLALVGWSSGCMLIWSAMFTIGNFLHGRTLAASLLLAVSIVSAVILSVVVSRLWNDSVASESGKPAGEAH